MKKMILWVSLCLGMLAGAPAMAEWVDISGGLVETEFQALAVDPQDPKILYAASSRRVYRTQDGGVNWKQSLGIRGSDNSIHFILVHPKDSQLVFVATEKGIHFSKDQGKRWQVLYRGVGERAKGVYGLHIDAQDPQILWAATADGLVKISLPDGATVSATGLPQAKFYSILQDLKDKKILWASGEKGIYKSVDGGAGWQRVMVDVRSAQNDGPEEGLSQFQIEELSVTPGMTHMIQFPEQHRLLASTHQGLWTGEKDGSDWSALKNAELPTKNVNDLKKGSEGFFVATDKGVFLRRESGAMKEISEGLESTEVRMLAYQLSSQDLYAATKKGIYRYPKPEFKPVEAVAGASPQSSPDAQEVLKKFASEPTIRQIQDATIRYAEVHPDKINAWRTQAARKALLPSLSLDAGLDKNQPVDLDRGGTNDPDKFIIGPEERSFDWSVGVNWDLGDLIWNNDQTSIDTRSRLMVELRDDVLNEVTHLYYERRRLQVEMLITPAKELPLQLERQIKLDELTAGIDGLTGGYLSQCLEVLHANDAGIGNGRG